MKLFVFTKTGTGGTDKVWLYNMEADGFSLDDKRNPVKENDIPDIVERFNNLDKEAERTNKDKSFFVTKEEIKKNWQLGKTFEPKMDDEKREKLIKGWKKAVKCALVYAED